MCIRDSHTETINLSIQHPGVTIEHVNGHTLLVIDPTYDLDLSSNYRLEVSAGALTGAVSHVANAAFSTNFSTVTPGVWNQGSSGVLAQKVDNTTGTLTATQKWLDMTNPANDDVANGIPQTFNALPDNYAFVLSDKDPDLISYVLEDGFIRIENFGLRDTFYLDDKFNLPDARTQFDDNIFTGGDGTSLWPFSGGFAGTSQSDKASIDIVLETALQADFQGGATPNWLVNYIPTIRDMFTMG